MSAIVVYFCPGFDLPATFLTLGSTFPRPLVSGLRDPYLRTHLNRYEKRELKMRWYRYKELYNKISTEKISTPVTGEWLMLHKLKTVFR